MNRTGPAAPREVFWSRMIDVSIGAFTGCAFSRPGFSREPLCRQEPVF